MASSTTISTAVNNDRSRARSRKKKKQFQHLTQQNSSSSSSSNSSSSNWKSQAQQQNYSTRLIKALRHVSQNGRGVRDAADRALAATARGRTRWSRAILIARGLRIKRRRKSSVAAAKRHAPPEFRSRRPRVCVLRLKAKNLPAIQRKAKVLGRLVPGCRKESLPVILEEAEDYIPALEMQIRAMTQLLDRLAGSASSS